MSLNKLVGFSLLGTAGVIGMNFLFQRKLSDTLKSSKYYKEAIDLVKNHEGVKQFLGEPIDDLRPEMVDPSFTFQGISEAKVVVCGPKSKGIVFITVTGDSNENLKLDSIELQIGNDKSKRLVIKEAKREISAIK